MRPMNEILADIVLAVGGSVTRYGNRNGLLNDWLVSAGGAVPPVPPEDGHIIAFINPNGVTGTWDFGDGNTSTDIDPTHEYVVHGTYNIVFTSTLGDNDLDYFIIIEAQPLPTGAFTYVVGNPDSNVLSFTATGGSSYLWDIDGTVYAIANPIHTFSDVADATYYATCIVSDAYGNADFVDESIFVQIPNVLPTGDFTFLRNKLEVTFTSAIVDPDGDDGELTYSWVFNDGLGGISTDRHPVFTFPDSPSGQTFTVELTATDERGGQVFVSHPVTVYTTEQLGTNLVINGDFITDDASSFSGSSASVSLVGGVMTVTGTSGSSGRMETSTTGMGLGTQYKLTLDYHVGVNSNQTIKNLIGFTTSGNVPLDSLTPTTEENYFVADEVNGLLRFYAGNTGNTIIITRISLQEVL